MADYDSSLPIRTENDGDVVVKVSDSTVPSQQLKVESDGSVNANVTATDLDIRDLTHASDSVKIGDGTEFAAVNASNELQVRDDDANTALSAINAKLVDGTDIGDVTINNAAGASAVNIQDGGNSITVDAVDLDVRDLSASSDSVAISDGTDTLAVNSDGSINVVVSGDLAGDEISDYQTSAAVAASASVNHDYTVNAGKTLVMDHAWVSGSGKLKVELIVNGASKFVGFNSTANPNVEIPLKRILKANAAEVVRLTITNRDKQPQDVYSTLLGNEI